MTQQDSILSAEDFAVMAFGKIACENGFTCQNYTENPVSQFCTTLEKLIKARDEAVRNAALDEAIDSLSTTRSYAGAQNDRTTTRYCSLAIDALQQLKTPSKE